MVRDDGWQFFLLGRCLEQVDMTSRMVASASLATGSANWPSVLRGVGGHDAFLRTYKGLHTDAEAAEFLLVDARFPRSVMHGLVAAEECLEKVDAGQPERTGSPRGRPGCWASCGPGWSTPRCRRSSTPWTTR